MRSSDSRGVVGPSSRGVVGPSSRLFAGVRASVCTFQPGKDVCAGGSLTHFLPDLILTKFLFAGRFCECGVLLVGCHLGVEIVISSGIHVMNPK